MDVGVAVQPSEPQHQQAGEEADSDPSAPQLVSLYPYPPQSYYTLYTNDNITTGKAPSPPPIPTDTYHIFGVPHELNATIIQDLEWQGIEPLYTKPCDRKATMQKMNTSLLANFVDLLEIMKVSPNSVSREQKLNDIEMLFIQLHHLLNTYRTMQARITLVCMKQHQIKQAMKCIKILKGAFNQVDTLLSKCRDMGTNAHELHKETLADIFQQLSAICGEKCEEKVSSYARAYCVMCDKWVEPEPHLDPNTFHNDCELEHLDTGPQQHDAGAEYLMKIVNSVLTSERADTKDRNGIESCAMETDEPVESSNTEACALWKQYFTLLNRIKK